MNAPSRIFIHPTERCPVSKVWNRGEWKDHDSGAHGDMEYIRADLVSQWQPIETAPKDGTKILGAWPQLRKHKWWTIQPIFFYYGAWIHGWDEDEDLALHPTHWMPLPEPPKTT